MSRESHEENTWTFLTNHSHVLLCLVRDSAMRMREIALEVGITERAVHKIITDLDTAGYIRREREGRHNRYKISRQAQLRHPIEKHKSIGDLIELVYGPPDGTKK